MTKPNLALLSIDAAAALRLCDALSDLFEGDAAVAAFEGAAGAWSVAIYFDASLAPATIRAQVARLAGKTSARRLRFEQVTSRDWVKASLEGLPPVPAGRFIVHGAHDRARVAPNLLAIEIEAALAFGTGHHGTTRGCLLALDALWKDARFRPKRILDVGTGSGVLAIAAAKALRRSLRGRVLASDIDPVAVKAARANARLNHTAALIDMLCAPGLGAGMFRTLGPYDLIFANILLPPLKRLARPLARLLAPSGRVILSGLLPDQANAALAAYRAHGLVLQHRINLDGWATLVLRA